MLELCKKADIPLEDIETEYQILDIESDKLKKEDYKDGKLKEDKLVELSQNELSEEEKKDIANG